MELNLNQNVNQCVKYTSNIGNTIYQNICNGSLNKVPWGSSDWMGFYFSCLVVAAFVSALLIVMTLIVKALREGQI